MFPISTTNFNWGGCVGALVIKTFLIKRRRLLPCCQLGAIIATFQVEDNGAADERKQYLHALSLYQYKTLNKKHMVVVPGRQMNELKMSKDLVARY